MIRLNSLLLLIAFFSSVTVFAQAPSRAVVLPAAKLYPAFAVNVEALAPRQQIIEALKNDLTDGGVSRYYLDHEQLQQLFMRDFPKTYAVYMAQIDQDFWQSYVEGSLQMGLRLSTTNPARKVIETFFAEGHPSVEWYRGVFENYSRGAFYHASHTVAMQLLAPRDMLFVLIHELTHKYDSHLDYALNWYLNDQAVGMSDAHSIDELSEADQKRFGQYWFYGQLYLRYFKEVEPRLNVCLAARELNLKPQSLDRAAPSSELTDELTRVDNKESCQDIVTKQIRKELEDHGATFRLFWSAGTWQGQLEAQTYLDWLQSLGFRQPIL
jgi:hypothetical protein